MAYFLGHPVEVCTFNESQTVGLLISA